jgi:hypothetical protein
MIKRYGCGAGSVPPTNGSGSRRPKNMWIRIPNTGYCNTWLYVSVMYYDVAGTISKQEARAALREHKGNIWAAVTECVETRQTKVLLLPHSLIKTTVMFVMGSFGGDRAPPGDGMNL